MTWWPGLATESFFYWSGEWHSLFTEARKEEKFCLKSSCVLCLVTQLCLTLCNTMDCSLPGSSVHGILQVRRLEWVAMPFTRGSFQARDWARISYITGRFFTTLYVAQLLLCCNVVKHFWPLTLTYASKKHMVVLILCICSWLSGMWLLCFMYYLQLSWGWWSWSPQELSRRPLCHHLLQVSPLPRGRRLSLRATLSRWTISYLTEILWLLYHFIL